MSLSLRAFDLAARQVELDRAATARFPSLLAHKRERMLPSPHAFLRGSAPLFYEILAAYPDLAAGPPGEGWIVGDMHLENVGAYRTDAEHVTFNLNDFDDAGVAPWRFDVLRLSTSVLLAGGAIGATGPEAIALAELLLHTHRGAAWGATKAPPLPDCVAKLVKEADARPPHALLDDRAPMDKGKRHLVRGARYADLPPEVRAQVPALLQAYLAALGDRAPRHAGTWEIEDAALRIAGTGSLGSLRIAVLVCESKSGDERLLDLKEEHPSSTEIVVGSAGATWPRSGERVVAAARALVREPARLLAAVDGGALAMSFVGRRLTPQEDKLAIDTFHVGSKLDAVVQTIGHLLGTAHARAVTIRPPVPWSEADLGSLLDHAVELAGLFEGAYLAYARSKT